MTPDVLARIDEIAKRSADSAPPLTDAQRHVIATMFRTTRRAAA
jgi:hypothetical protein